MFLRQILYLITVCCLTLSQTLEVNITVGVGGDVSVQCTLPDSRALPPWVINGKYYASTSLPPGMKYDPRNSTLTISNVQLHHHKTTIHCVHPVNVTPSNITKIFIVNLTTTNSTSADIASFIIQTSTVLFPSEMPSAQKANIGINIGVAAAIFIIICIFATGLSVICYMKMSKRGKNDVQEITTVSKETTVYM